MKSISALCLSLLCSAAMAQTLVGVKVDKPQVLAGQAVQASVAFDVDVPVHQAFNYPALYRLSQNGLDFSTKALLRWIFWGLLQGSAIILLSIRFFSKNMLDIATITFTALIFIENLNIFTLVRTWHPIMTIALLFNITCYLICLIPFGAFFDLSPIEPWLFVKILAATLAGWLPFHLSNVIQRNCFPTQIDKVIKEARTQEKRRQLGGRFRVVDF